MDLSLNLRVLFFQRAATAKVIMTWVFFLLPLGEVWFIRYLLRAVWNIGNRQDLQERNRITDPDPTFVGLMDLRSPILRSQKRIGITHRKYTLYQKRIIHILACISCRCMSPAPLFWFRIRKWAQSFVLRLYTIVYVSFRLYTFYFSSPPRGAGNMLSPPFLILDSKMGSIICTSLYSIVYLF